MPSIQVNIDQPHNCSECPFHHYDEDDDWCALDSDTETWYPDAGGSYSVSFPPTCPLLSKGFLDPLDVNVVVYHHRTPPTGFDGVMTAVIDSFRERYPVLRLFQEKPRDPQDRVIHWVTKPIDLSDTNKEKL